MYVYFPIITSAPPEEGINYSQKIMQTTDIISPIVFKNKNGTDVSPMLYQHLNCHYLKIPKWSQGDPRRLESWTAPSGEIIASRLLDDCSGSGGGSFRFSDNCINKGRSQKGNRQQNTWMGNAQGTSMRVR